MQPDLSNNFEKYNNNCNLNCKTLENPKYLDFYLKHQSPCSIAISSDTAGLYSPATYVEPNNLSYADTMINGNL